MRDTVWQYDPESYKFGSSQGMAWEEDECSVMDLELEEVGGW